MICLYYATTGKEFQVAEALAERGIEAWCGKRIRFIRDDKRRLKPVEIPALPNYLFLTMPPEDWNTLRDRPVKHLASTFYILGKADEAQLARFKAEIEADHKLASWKRDNASRADLTEYVRGQKVRVLKGHLAESVLTFRKLVQRAHDLYPKVQGEVEMFGRVVTVEVDPLDTEAEG